MNQSGKLSRWDDAKGFGFITPAKGGEKVFAHISCFAGRGRPRINRRVTYSIVRDKQGRLRAGRFQYVGAARLGAGLAPGAWLAGLIVLLWFAALSALAQLGYMPLSIPGAYAAVSLVTVLMYWQDKRAAGREARRTPENRLHLFELLCGWPGALLAQQVLRHKTRKASYQFVFWLAVLANLAALGWLLLAPEAMVLREQMGFDPALSLWSFIR